MLHSSHHSFHCLTGWRVAAFLPALICLEIPTAFAAPPVAPKATTVAMPQTLPAATEKRLRTLLADPALAAGHVGIAIRALGKVKNSAQQSATPYPGGKTPLLFSIAGNQRFLPASNQKLFTAAWVLAKLGSQKKFTTQILMGQANFVQKNAWPVGEPLPLSLTLDGEGDPSLTSDDLTELAQQIAANPEIKGQRVLVKVSPSRLGAEENGRRYPDGWTLDDTIWYYGAPVTGWALNRNEVDVTVTGGKPGEPATMTVDPQSPFIIAGEPTGDEPDTAFSIFNSVTTVAKDAEGLHFDRGDINSPLSDSLVIRGSIEAGKSDTEGVAVPNPRAWLETELAAKLRAAGVTVLDSSSSWSVNGSTPVAKHQSVPLSQIVRRFLKNSDNLYGEMLLRRAAYDVKTTSKNWPQIASTGLAARGHGAMLDWLSQNHVWVPASRFSDGSGLSRYDVQTPVAITDLLALAQKTKDATAFYDALPVAGVDGTLKNRMKGTSAVGNVRAKTGTFSIANCLSGYVTTKQGNRLAVSIMTNFVPDGEAAREWQGKVFTALAEANF